MPLLLQKAEKRCCCLLPQPGVRHTRCRTMMMMMKRFILSASAVKPSHRPHSHGSRSRRLKSAASSSQAMRPKRWYMLRRSALFHKDSRQAGCTSVTPILEVTTGERVSTSITCRSASRTPNSPNRNRKTMLKSAATWGSKCKTVQRLRLTSDVISFISPSLLSHSDH